MPPLRSIPLFLLALAASSTAQNTFDWSQLEPSTNLTWVDCNSGFQCARLEVPLDYSSPNIGTATIAVIRLPANVSSSDSTYRGPLLFNPGGPGGPGVEALLAVGTLLASIFGPEFDIVSFDPRGIGFSTPIASFFNSAVEDALWNAGNPSESLNSSSDSTAIARVWGLSQIQGQLAAQRDTSGIFKYMTTDSVARDMLLMTQKMGYEKIQYYGLSYGSLLGATFAALFPDKIHRIVLDGVLDADGWFQANLTLQASATDSTLDAFFTGCAAAGPTLCAFAPSANSTAQELSDRLTALTNSIRAQPLPVITPTGYGLVDYSLLRQTLFRVLYTPYALFPLLAQALADLEAGNGTTLFSILAQPQFQCSSDGPSTDPVAATFGIMCGDAVEVHDTIEELTAFYLNAAKLSQFAEFLVGSGRVTCSGWKVYREGRFTGPVAAANTSFPMLFLSNTADPVTPIESALKTLANFPGSAILIQDSPGHTSTTAPSLCTSGFLKDYMTNGTLPPPGTVCPVDATLFGSVPSTDAGENDIRTRNEEDERTIMTLKRIGELLRPFVARGM
ncbi:TAP-like protein-domain-containing protein [Mycena amicta]|nr:TAP-like protein-domain-containing protein [Mycena amicta]